MFNALKKTLKAFFSKNKNSKNKSKKSKMNGGKLSVYYGEVTDSSGKSFTNSNFSKGNNRGFNSYWQDINQLLEKHVEGVFSKSEIVTSGFGGDDGSGTVVVNSTKSLPPMPFTINNKAYTMTFKSRNV
jgi:hypothetical protein